MTMLNIMPSLTFLRDQLDDEIKRLEQIRRHVQSTIEALQLEIEDDKYLDEQGDTDEVWDMPIPATVFNRDDLVATCDDFLDYIYAAKTESELKRLSPPGVPIFSTSMGLLWAEKMKVFMKQTGVKLNVEEIYYSQPKTFVNLTYSNIITEKWEIHGGLIAIMDAAQFEPIFGQHDMDEFADLKARYILLVEMIRWSAIDPFESGRKFKNDVNSKRLVKQFITPRQFFKGAMRIRKDDENKSVKLESFTQYLRSRLNQARDRVRASIEKPVSVAVKAKKKQIIINPNARIITYGEKDKATGKTLVGRAKWSEVPHIRGYDSEISEVINSSRYYLVRIKGVLKKNGEEDRKFSIYRYAILDNMLTDEAKAIGAIRVELVTELNKSRGIYEAFNYEEWLMMNPIKIKKEQAGEQAAEEFASSISSKR